MATKIKLMRLGKKHDPQYRIVVADARTKRDGRAIETIGKYHPKQDPSLIEVTSERAQYWLSVGAQPTEPVLAILKRTGDWQKFKGLPAPEPLLTAAPRPDKRALFEAAAKQAASEPATEATTPKKKSGRKAARSGEATGPGGDKSSDRASEQAGDKTGARAGDSTGEKAGDNPAERTGEPGAQADASAEK